MTITDATGADPTTIDTTATPPVPLTRLTRVELRKLVDTRAGRWLLITQALLMTLASGLIVLIVAVQDEPIALMDFIGIAGFVMAFLLPIMGIMAVTSEWSQRTHMCTFTLEPRRGRVIAAKMLAVTAAAVGSVGVALLVGYLSSAAATAAGVDVDWNVSVEGLLGFAFLQILTLLTGFALGTLLLSAPAAIVCFFALITVVPVLLAVGAEGLTWFADVRPWLDFNEAQLPLMDAADDPDATGFSGVHWGQFATSGAIWFVLPLALGVRRTLHAEIT